MSLPLFDCPCTLSRHSVPKWLWVMIFRLMRMPLSFGRLPMRMPLISRYGGMWPRFGFADLQLFWFWLSVPGHAVIPRSLRSCSIILWVFIRVSGRSICFIPLRLPLPLLCVRFDLLPLKSPPLRTPRKRGRTLRRTARFFQSVGFFRTARFLFCRCVELLVTRTNHVFSSERGLFSKHAWPGPARSAHWPRL